MKIIKHKDKWYLQSDTGYKEILLSTDQDLIKDGVQAIDDEFLEWFVNNQGCEEVEVKKSFKANPKYNEGTLLTEKVGYWEYKIIIQKEEPFNSKRGLIEVKIKDPNDCEYYKEVGCVKDICDCYTLVPKQETLEEFANKAYPFYGDVELREAIELGAKWQKEQDKKLYSEEDFEQFKKRKI